MSKKLVLYAKKSAGKNTIKRNSNQNVEGNAFSCDVNIRSILNRVQHENKVCLRILERWYI